jgi:hypothetical protein
MKIIGKFFIFVSLMLLMFACNGMNDIQKEYLDMAEINYIGKPVNLTFYNGYKRAVLAWRLNADPKIKKCIITWNDGAGKEEVSLSANANDSIMHSVALAEGTYNFKVYQENENGEKSLTLSGSAISYGDTYQSTLDQRPFTLDLSDTKCTFNWQTVDGAVQSILAYTNKSGKQVEVVVPVDSTSTTISDFSAGTNFTVRTGYVPDQSLDTIYSVPQEGIFPDYFIPDESEWKIVYCNSDNRFYGSDADHAGAPAMIDGNVNTYWQWALDGDWAWNINGGDDYQYNFTDYHACEGDRNDNTQVIVIDMKQSRKVMGVGIVQPQNLWGCLKAATFYVSDDSEFKFLPVKSGGKLSDYNDVALNNWTKLFEYDDIPFQKAVSWKQLTNAEIMNGGVKGRFLKIAIITGSAYGTHGSRIAEVKIQQLKK